MLSRWYPAITAYASELAKWNYTALECVGCRLVYQQQLPSSELLAKVYGEWLPSTGHPRDNKVFQYDLAHPKLTRPGQETHAFAAACGKPISALRIFDYGMGWGRYPICAAKLGAQAFGYDLSAPGCAYAAENGVNVVAPRDFDGLQADVVNCDQTLEHVPDPMQVMALLARAAVVGGIVKINVPQARDLVRRFAVRDFKARAHTANSLNPLHPLEHLQCFNRHSLDALARSAGLTPMAIPLGAELAYFRALELRDVVEVKRVVKAAARPAYDRWSRHNLCAWYRKRA
jgi:2-polyprenyl-3-methyl-5-hydroxy-6-metoxy-1,4-benzoquinol methylase